MSAIESLDTTDSGTGDQRPWWYFAHVQHDQNLHILCMFKGTYLIDGTHTDDVQGRLATMEAGKWAWSQKPDLASCFWGFFCKSRSQWLSFVGNNLGRWDACIVKIWRESLDIRKLETYTQKSRKAKVKRLKFKESTDKGIDGEDTHHQTRPCLAHIKRLDNKL